MVATTDLPLPLLAKLAVVALPAQPTEAASLPTELVAGTAVSCSPTATVLPLVNFDTSNDTTPPSSPNIVPLDDLTLENIPEVCFTIPVDDTVVLNYQLPFSHNRGKPPN